MKKVIWLSGVFAVLILILILAGWAGPESAVTTALRQGRQFYDAADYPQALSIYEEGLAKSVSESEKTERETPVLRGLAASRRKEKEAGKEALHFDAAQTAYMLGDYEKALEHYQESTENPERFIKSGNACVKQADATEDLNQKVQYLVKALQFFKEGITNYTQDVTLKFNYEYVRAQLEELSQEMEQDQEEQQEQQEQQDQEQEQQEQQEGQDGEQQDEESQDQQEQQEQQGEEGEEQQQGQEGDQQEQQDEEEQDAESQEQQEQQDGEEGDEQQNASVSAQEDEAELIDQETIERILRVLEAQEEESLKNNQEIFRGSEKKKGWEKQW